MNTRQLIGYVILRQHDFCDPGKILRLLVFHPQQLGRRKSGEGNVGCVSGELFLADHIVQIITFFVGSAVIPQDSGTDHRIILIQDHQSVHLSAEADSRNLTLVLIL